MISDVLFEAIEEITRYRTDPVFAKAYSDPEVTRFIDDVVAGMDRLRKFLDNPLSGDECAESRGECDEDEEIVKLIALRNELLRRAAPALDFEESIPPCCAELLRSRMPTSRSPKSRAR